MRIAICDNDQTLREELLAFAAEYRSRNPGLDINFSPFAYAEDLLETAEKIGGFDIYFLNIIMPDINGITLGVRLREHDFDGKIIFLSSSREYAIDSFQAKPFNYLLKPIERETFLSALNEAVHSIAEKKERSLIVKTKECSIRLPFESIMFAELNRRTIVYHLTNGKTVESIQIRTSFHDATQELLKDHRFVLCGASMVANLCHISMIENNALIFKDYQKAYLGKKACREVRSLWYDFCCDREGDK